MRSYSWFLVPVAMACFQASAQNVDVTAAQNLRLTPGNGSISTIWNPASSAPYGYLVRWRKRGSGSILGRSVVSGTSHTIRGLTNGTGYLVAVDTNFGSDGGILSPGG